MRTSGRPERAERRPGRSRSSLRLAEGDLAAIIWSGACFAAMWPLAEAWHGPRPILVVPVVAHVAGMLAGYGVLVLIGLMSRAPAIEHGVGADVLTRWHARGGRIVMVLVVVHAVAATQAWATSKHEATVLAL